MSGGTDSRRRPYSRILNSAITTEVAQNSLALGIPADVALGADDGEPLRRHRPRQNLGSTVSGLVSVSFAITIAALFTGPLQAHALGPTGRGELAEVLVPTSLAAVVGEFGLGMFAMRAVARGQSPGVLLGTVGAIFLVIGAVGGFFSSVLATLIVGHRQPVQDLLVIGFILLPSGLLANLAGGMCAGLERWRAYNVSRLIPPFGTLVAFIVLMLNGCLTVISAAAVSFITGGLSLLPLLWSLRKDGQLRFDPAIAREGARYGSKAWLGTLLGTANAQIVQLLMIAFLGPLQLGLFAVALNVANSSDQLSTSVYSAIFPRVAAGDRVLAARASRITILLVGCASAVVAVISPFAIPVVFGSRFAASVPMVEVLLIYVVGSAACRVYGSALSSAGRPGLISGGDLLSLVSTVIALLVLLPILGGVGASVAAVVSVAIVMTYLLYWCRREFTIPVHDFLFVQRSDVAWMLRQVAVVLSRLPISLPSVVVASVSARARAFLR